MSPFETTVLLNSAIFVGLAIVASFAGHWLAKILQAADYGRTYGIVLFAVLAGAAIVVRCWPSRPRIDQVGGTILVFKVDEQKTTWRPEKMDSLLTAIGRRVNPRGWKNISVRSAGDDLVEVAIPNVQGQTAEQKQVEADAIRRIIRTTGALEFRIVATMRDNESLIEKAKTERTRLPVAPRQAVLVRDPKSGEVLAKWCRLRDQEVDKLKGDEAAMMVGKIKARDAQGKEVEREKWEVLVLAPESAAYDVTGADLREARAEIDENGSPEVGFCFNPAGGAKFGHLTGEHVPVGNFRYKLAIVLDDVVQTAPNIISAITDRGRITGNFTQQEVHEIVAIIDAGSLPAALEPTPIREITVEGAASGGTSLSGNVLACIVPMILVFAAFLSLVLFMPRKREQGEEANPFAPINK